MGRSVAPVRTTYPFPKKSQQMSYTRARRNALRRKREGGMPPILQRARASPNIFFLGL
jgi:hypothetical protein